jgi:hypothetical protein
VKLNNDEPFEYVDEIGSSTILLKDLNPGYYSAIVEAFDAAGNSTVASYTFTITAFDKPMFTQVPTELTGGVIPVITGETRPNAIVSVFLRRAGSDSEIYTVTADETGAFTFIPDGELYNGVYELSAQAEDEFGAQSAVSDIVRIAVQEPGYVRIGSQVMSIMSVVVPTVLLLAFLLLGLWYILFVYRKLRRAVTVEGNEALAILERQFGVIQNTLRTEAATVKASRKTNKLTKCEAELVTALQKQLDLSEAAVRKEIEDVTNLT